MTTLLFAFAVGLAALPQASKREGFYIGTYTSPDGSKGIYRAELDAGTGELSAVQLAAEASNPSYLAIHPSGEYLYAVHEEPVGSVSAYVIGTGGWLSRLNTQPVEGAGQCHVSVDPSGRALFTAAYDDGVLDSLPIHEDGSLGKVATAFRSKGSGPDKSRQQGPHMHSAYADPEGHFVYACDLGTDEVHMFHLHEKTAVLTASKPASFHVAPGGGPRHLAFGPHGNFVYVNSEMGNAVTVFSRSAAGLLTQVQSISTLPDGENHAGKTTAEIECHRNGKWLYVSNRGDDSIAVFRILKDGRLERIEIAPSGVKIPRGFAIDPSGRWLVVAGQDSDDVTTLAIDPATGKLTPSGHKLTLSKPVCILFALAE